MNSFEKLVFDKLKWFFNEQEIYLQKKNLLELFREKVLNENASDEELKKIFETIDTYKSLIKTRQEARKKILKEFDDLVLSQEDVKTLENSWDEKINEVKEILFEEEIEATNKLEVFQVQKDDFMNSDEKIVSLKQERNKLVASIEDIERKIFDIDTEIAKTYNKNFEKEILEYEASVKKFQDAKLLLESLIGEKRASMKETMKNKSIELIDSNDYKAVELNEKIKSNKEEIKGIKEQISDSEEQIESFLAGKNEEYLKFRKEVEELKSDYEGFIKKAKVDAEEFLESFIFMNGKVSIWEGEVKIKK